MSFAGLHFENEPVLTELHAAEGRRNRRLYLKGGNENGGKNWSSNVIGQAKNRMAATSSIQETKTNWTFRNLQCSFMLKSQPPE